MSFHLDRYLVIGFLFAACGFHILGFVLDIILCCKKNMNLHIALAIMQLLVSKFFFLLIVRYYVFLLFLRDLFSLCNSYVFIIESKDMHKCHFCSATYLILLLLAVSIFPSIYYLCSRLILICLFISFFSSFFVFFIYLLLWSIFALFYLFIICCFIYF